MVKAARPSGSVLTNACKSGALSLPSAMDQDGRATARASPPAAVAPTFRSALRETLAASAPDTGRVSVSVVCRMLTPSLARVFYGSSNAIVGAASAYIAGHRVVYLRVRRAWIARQQRGCRHDLPRLTRVDYAGRAEGLPLVAPVGKHHHWVLLTPATATPP